MNVNRKKRISFFFSLSILAVYGLLNGYILLNLSHAHLHWTGGLLIAHWHPHATSSETHDGPKGPPLGKHAHTLGDICNLMQPVNGQHVSTIILPELLVQEANQAAPPFESQSYHGQEYLVTNSSRSPPRSSA